MSKPTHYKAICISMYTADIEQLDAKVAELKRRGWTKANKSHLVRIALASFDLDAIERALATAGMVRRASKERDLKPDNVIQEGATTS